VPADWRVSAPKVSDFRPFNRQAGHGLKAGWTGESRTGSGRIAATRANHPASFESNDGSRAAREFLVVCYEDKRGAGLGVEVEEQFDDAMACLAIEIAGWFVREENLRTIDERACDGHALLLAARELGGIVMQSFAQSYASQQLNGFLERMVQSAEFHRHHHVFQRCDGRDELEVLKDKPAHAATQFSAAILVQGCQVFACEGNAAGSRDVESGTEAEEGRLAAAGWAEDGAGVAAREGKGDVAQNGEVVAIFPVRRRGIAFGQSVNFEDQTFRHE
jgi:hypothetical protein